MRLACMTFQVTTDPLIEIQGDGRRGGARIQGGGGQRGSAQIQGGGGRRGSGTPTGGHKTER